MELDEFMAANPPKRRRSPLWDHQGAIRSLRLAGNTVEQIRDYLVLQGVRISAVRITQFICNELGLRKNSAQIADQVKPLIPEIRRNAQTHTFTPPAPARETPAEDGITANQMAEYAALVQLGRKQ